MPRPSAARKVLEGGRSFEVRTAYDAQNLYVAYHVTGQAELVNAVADPRLIFQGGNLLDIQIATDPGADPKRKKPVLGDLRILVTRQAGHPRAVIFRPKVKGFRGEPIVLKSPTGTESFDSIETTDRIGLEYSHDPRGSSFDATVTIPLDLIGWQPKAGTKVKMDVGYVFGNPGGTHAMRRSYWSNNSFAANVLDDIPHESRLEPDQWGEAEVE